MVLFSTGQDTGVNGHNSGSESNNEVAEIVRKRRAAAAAAAASPIAAAAAAASSSTSPPFSMTQLPHTTESLPLSANLSSIASDVNKTVAHTIAHGPALTNTSATATTSVLPAAPAAHAAHVAAPAAVTSAPSSSAAAAATSVLPAHVAAPVAAVAAAADDATYENISVNGINIHDIPKYLRDHGEYMTDRAFRKVKENFFSKSVSTDTTGKIAEEEKLNKLKTISDVQAYEQELVKKLEKAEQDIINAPEKSNDAKDGPKLKGAMKQNRDAQKKYNDLLIPVLHVLESKIKASNTLLTLMPLVEEFQSLETEFGENNPKTIRQLVVAGAAHKQYATEIKDVLYGEHNILEMKTRKNWRGDESVNAKKIINTKETVKTGALAILPGNTELQGYKDTIESIIKSLEGKKNEPGPASSAPLRNKDGTPFITPRNPLMVTVPIKHKDGRITYDSYKMGEDGTLNKMDEKNEYRDAVVDDLFKKAVQSAKEGTKVVKMIYKDEPLIVSLNISRPHESKEKFKHNLDEGLKKESNRIVYPGTQNTMKPATKLTALNNARLNYEKQQIENQMEFVNKNIGVLEANKAKLKDAIKETKLEPIKREIERRAALKKGGFTAKKSKKNNKTKKSTRRSS